MNEETVGAFFEYPYNQFLMTRLEFILLTEDELEAKVMRIVENEMLKLKAIWQRAVIEAIEKKQPIPEEPKEYWVTISQGLFLAFLYKYDTSVVGAKHPNSLSRTTLRRAINALIETKKFLQIRAKPGNEYGPPQYTLNQNLIQEKLRQLPKNPMTLFLGGVSKLEGGSFQIPNSPSFQKGKSPVSKKESPQFPNSEPPIYSNLDNIQDKENTYVVLSNDENDAPTPVFVSTLFSHPHHPFLFLDDERAPTTLLVYLTSREYESEMEDDRRSRIAQEVKYNLEQQGHHITYKWLREEETTIVESTPSLSSQQNGNVTQASAPPETLDPPTHVVEIPHPERENSSFSEATQPLPPNTQPTTTPSPEFDSQREIEALDQQEQQQANTKSEASDLRIAEETTNTSSSGESAREQKPAEYPAPSKPRSRRTKKEVDSTEVTARVTHVYAYFDTLAQEITGVTDYHYNPNTKSADAIKAWLKTNPTEELLHEVFLELWNSSPDPRTGFTWKNNMRIPSILKEYDNRVLAIKARRSKKHVNHLVTAATNLGGHTLKPEDFDDDEVVYQTKQQRKRA